MNQRQPVDERCSLSRRQDPREHGEADIRTRLTHSPFRLPLLCVSVDARIQSTVIEGQSSFDARQPHGLLRNARHQYSEEAFGDLPPCLNFVPGCKWSFSRAQ